MDAVNEVKVKKEEDVVDSKGRHSHQFTVKFPHDDVEYSVYCDQSCTVLEAIKSNLNERFTKMNCTDEKIIIQLSDKGRESIIATHFPCSCIENDECLTIHCKTQEFEQTKGQHGRILPRDKYSVFYVSTKGGHKTKTKKLFRSNTVKQFDFLCVYAKKGMTVREALERDGRFVDLEDFKLSDYTTSNELTLCTEKVDSLHQKTFRICLPKLKTDKASSEKEQATREQQGQEKQTITSRQFQQKVDTKAVLVKAQQRGISVGRAMKESGSTVDSEEIYKLLCEQMKSRFPRSSYQETLKLKKQNFGKIQQSFSEIHRIRKLLKLGQSVCLLKFRGSKCEVQGTGFVLYDNIIMTNVHLFQMCTDLPQDKWRDQVEITAEFNYENPDGEPNKKEFKAQLFGSFDALDYAILELDIQSSNQTAGAEEAEVPAGLLSIFGPSPEGGEACLIGHPAGGKKKIDPTCIIAKEEREQAVGGDISILYAINQEFENNPYGDVLVTYNTFMYHGASGSPVFDAHGRVFGLHTGGCLFPVVKPEESVLESAYSLLTIFRDFVGRLREGGHKDQLERVKEAAKGNSDLENIIEEVDAEEAVDTE